VQFSAQLYERDRRIRLRPMLHQLTLFLWLVLLKWQGYVTGGVLVAILAVAERKTGRQLPWAVFKWIFGVFFLLLSVFLVWRDQYTSAEWRGNRVVELSAELAESASQVAQLKAQVTELQAELKARPAMPTQRVTQSGSGNQTVVGAQSRINQQSSGDCSPNNIGSGNTTNCEPKSRVMTDAGHEGFYEELATTKGMLRVVPASSATDVFPLGQQMCASASKAKWSLACPDSRNSSMGRDVVAKGLVCYSENWNESGAVAFKKAMKAASLACRYVPKAYDFGGVTLGGTGGVTVVIGDP
jgi:hypothetical protein